MDDIITYIYIYIYLSIYIYSTIIYIYIIMFANYISHSFCAILAAQNLTAAGGPTAECPAATTSPTPSAAEGGQSGSS